MTIREEDASPEDKERDLLRGDLGEEEAVDRRQPPRVAPERRGPERIAEKENRRAGKVEYRRETEGCRLAEKEERREERKRVVAEPKQALAPWSQSRISKSKRLIGSFVLWYGVLG